MDSHAFASLAQVRILLVPVGGIQKSTFDKLAAEIRTFSEIRLGDIPADIKDERARFMPSPLSTGYLHLSYPARPPPHSQGPLTLFRPSQFSLAVVGVAMCSQADELSPLLAQFNDFRLEMAPLDFLYPLAWNLFVFEDGDGATQLTVTGNLPGLVIIPSVMGNKKLYLGTLLADLCSRVLGEFGRVVQTLETGIGNEYLNAVLLPSLPPASELRSTPETISKRDSLPPLLTQHSEPGLNAVVSANPLKRNSSAGLGIRQPTINLPPPKKRAAFGAASSHGRLFKVLGDFFLLAGKTEDAVIWYSEAIALLKTPQDAIWHASALEGMATVSVLDAWSSGYGLNSSLSNGGEPWSGVSEKLSQAISLYRGATASSDPEQPYSLLAYLYCCAVLRHASLLFSVWSAKGWGPLAFANMLQPSSSVYLPPTVSDANTDTWAHLERLSGVSGMSRSLISSILGQGHGPWLLHLAPGERIAILEMMAATYACLGYKRKEAYLLREVLGCVIDLLVCDRKDNEAQRVGLSVVIPSRQVQDDLKPNDSVNIQGNVGVRRGESSDGNESVLRLLKHVCTVLGVDIESVGLIVTEVDAQQNGNEQGNRAGSSGADFPEDDMDDSGDLSGWPELQVGVVREAVAVAEALPVYPKVVQFALSSLRTLHHVLSPADQYYLYALAARCLVTARRREELKCVEYWSGRPLVGIAVSPLPPARMPLENPISALVARASEADRTLPSAQDPFLYNPRKLVAQGQSLLVQNELVEVVVTLQNPFVFDLELKSLTLSTSGVPFECNTISVVVPPSSLHVITMTGIATEAGLLTIRGCVVQAAGSASREFLLPLSTDAELEKRLRRRSTLDCERGRFKYSGLDFRSWKKTGKRLSFEMSSKDKRPAQFLECKVIPEQPLLRIRRTSLVHGAIMLYNGETITMRLTLENVSTLPVDFLTLSFDDSTVGPAQQALAEGNSSVFETYETEYDLLHRPTFAWQNQKEAKAVAPGQSVTAVVACYGKPGCTEGTVNISYSYVDRRRSAFQGSTEVFHTRQISYPVMITVYHMLECHTMDILSYPDVNLSDGIEVSDAGRVRRSTLRVDDQSSWCLFSIEVRNTYGLPFDVTFERLQEGGWLSDSPTSLAFYVCDAVTGTEHIAASAVVPPGSTTRILLPLKKFLLSEDQVAQAIPTLSDRQFVVTKSKLTSAEDKAQRELFWYREHLFKLIRGQWRETGGTRSGEISLRQQRFALPMLERVRIEKARVQMTLLHLDANGRERHRIPIQNGATLPRPNEFLYLRTKVVNLSVAPLTLTLDFTMEPAEHIIVEGVLTDVSVGRLDSGEYREIETVLCVLCLGRFEICVTVRSLGEGSAGTVVGAGRLRAVVRADDR